MLVYQGPELLFERWQNSYFPDRAAEKWFHQDFVKLQQPAYQDPKVSETALTLSYDKKSGGWINKDIQTKDHTEWPMQKNLDIH